MVKLSYYLSSFLYLIFITKYFDYIKFLFGINYTQLLER
jgi:hypothetical protein